MIDLGVRKNKIYIPVDSPYNKAVPGYCCISSKAFAQMDQIHKLLSHRSYSMLAYIKCYLK